MTKITIKNKQHLHSLYLFFSHFYMLYQLNKFITKLQQQIDFCSMIFLFVLLFVSASAQYDPNMGKGLCGLTVASYCNPNHLADWSCLPCKNSQIQLANVKLFKNSTGDTLGFIATNSQMKAIVLVFRGTLPWDIKNWITDIDFIPTDYPLCNGKCKVHKGFFEAYMQIHSQIISSISDYEKRFGLKNYIITGHSLGAAISTHAAAYLTSLGKNIIYFYNFGSPRVGTPAFATWFESYFKGNFKARITHGRDPVPHLPLQAMDFRHIKTEIFYEGKVEKGYKVCKQAQDRTCSDKYLNDTNVLDHVTYFDFDYTGIVLACQA